MKSLKGGLGLGCSLTVLVLLVAPFAYLVRHGLKENWNVLEWAALVSVFSGIATLIVAALAFGSLSVNRGVLKAMQEEQSARSQAIILLSFRQKDYHQIDLYCANYGNGPASKVRFHSEPPMVDHNGRVIGKGEWFERGLAIMLPGEERETDLDSIPSYFDALYYLGQRASGFDVTVEHDDVFTGKARAATKLRIDLQQFGAPEQAPGSVIDRERVRLAAWKGHTHPTASELGAMALAKERVVAAGFEVDDEKGAYSLSEEIRKLGWKTNSSRGNPCYAFVAYKRDPTGNVEIVAEYGWNSLSAVLPVLSRVLDVESSWRSENA